MCYLYAKQKNKTLYLYDTRNNISSEYHLILDTFQALPRIEPTYLNGLTLHETNNKEMNDYYKNLSEETLSSEAKQIFRYSKKTQENVDLFIQNLPSFDCGIHIRTGDKIQTGEMIAIPIERYKDELQKFQHASGKQTLSIYLMTDSQEVLQYFQKKKESSWTIFSLPSPNLFKTGHDQATYNSLPIAIKQKAFYHFLAELQIMQSCPHILCTFSSNIGRFLNLLKKGTIYSLD